MNDLSRAHRIEELLADRAVFGIDPGEAAELSELLAAAGRSDDQSLERVAATAALQGTHDPLPAALRDRVLDDYAQRESLTPEPLGGLSLPSQRRPWPWYTSLAVAAGVLVSMSVTQLAGPPSAARQRDLLVATAGDLVRVAWAPQEDTALHKCDGPDAYGDVVWSDAAQRGYMTFRGLRANNPKVEQYQLWVFDDARDAAHPVDGGVFDIPAGTAEAVVPIDAKLPVTRATLFAVTVERPGGVVVSDRARLPLLAKR